MCEASAGVGVGSQQSDSRLGIARFSPLPVRSAEHSAWTVRALGDETAIKARSFEDEGGTRSCLQGELKPSCHQRQPPPRALVLKGGQPTAWGRALPVRPPRTPLGRMVPTLNLQEARARPAPPGWKQGILRLLRKRLHSYLILRCRTSHTSPGRCREKESLWVSLCRKWDFINISHACYFRFAQLL